MAFAYSGIVLSALSFALYPTFAMAAFTAGHVAMYQIFRRLGIPKPPKNWGKIFDAKTKKPLGRAIVRIFDQKFNRLLETQVTDMRGRYAFLVGQNTYDLTADLKGFEKQEIKSLDVKDEFVGKDIGLAKAK